jgi:hypothetical protein
MADGTSTNEAIDELVGRTDEAASAWMRGDMGRYLALTHHARGFTLMDPGGGPARRFDDRAETFKGWQSPFAGGEARLEHVETHAWGDTAVLVMIEQRMARSAACPTRTCRYASPRSTAAKVPTGSWCIATPTRSSVPSTSSRSPCSPAATSCRCRRLINRPDVHTCVLRRQ